MISVKEKEGEFWFHVSCWSLQPNHPFSITVSFVLTSLWLTSFLLWNTVVLPAFCFWANIHIYLTGHMNWSYQCVHLCFTSQPWIIPLQLAYFMCLENEVQYGLCVQVSSAISVRVQGLWLTLPVQSGLRLLLLPRCLFLSHCQMYPHSKAAQQERVPALCHRSSQPSKAAKTSPHLRLWTRPAKIGVDMLPISLSSCGGEVAYDEQRCFEMYF